MGADYHITLDDEVGQILDALVASGRFVSHEAAVHYAIDRLVDDERGFQAHVGRLRDAIAMGNAEADRGEGEDAKVVLARLRDQYQSPLP